MGIGTATPITAFAQHEEATERRRRRHDGRVGFRALGRDATLVFVRVGIQIVVILQCLERLDDVITLTAATGRLNG